MPSGTFSSRRGRSKPRHRATIPTLAQILKRPVWLAGGALQVSGWVLQAAALDRGSLVVVQSLCAMSLVIALPVGARLTNQQIDRRVILGAVAMIAGIVLFLSVGQPQKGVAHPSAAAWWSACISAAVIVFLLARIGRRHDGALRALYFGAAAGVGFALQASVTKEFMSIFGGGLDAIVHSWTTYALVASAVVGFVLQQSALKTGVLAPAMASSNAVTLFGSVVFGVTIFEEKLSNRVQPVGTGDHRPCGCTGRCGAAGRDQAAAGGAAVAVHEAVPTAGSTGNAGIMTRRQGPIGLTGRHRAES